MRRKFGAFIAPWIRSRDKARGGVIAALWRYGDDEHAFFIDLGQRIAHRRKDLGLTQVQLAELLGVSQQAMNSLEKGRRWIPVSSLPAIARAVNATLDELIVDAAPAATRATARTRGPAPKIQQPLEQLSRLLQAKQRAVKPVLDAVLAQPG